jgi:hypothetical protein
MRLGPGVTDPSALEKSRRFLCPDKQSGSGSVPGDHERQPRKFLKAESVVSLLSERRIKLATLFLHLDDVGAVIKDAMATETGADWSPEK